MGAQDRTEKVLRSLHVMLSKSEIYPSQPTKVIVDKEQMLELLKELNKCTYAMMEEYELTLRSRDKAERAFRKKGDEIIWDASRKAEDIYAASVMYTDEALNETQEIMREAKASVKKIYKEMEVKLKEQEQLIRRNQSELKSQLQDLVDTEKYLKLIDDRNKEIKKEKAEKEGKPVVKEPSIYANRQTPIRINKEYFESHGIPLEEDSKESARESALEQAKSKVLDLEKDLEMEVLSEESIEPSAAVVEKSVIDFDEAAVEKIIMDETKLAESFEAELEAKLPEIKVDLDADYFRWKEEQEKGNQSEEAKDDQSEEGRKFWKFGGKKTEK